MQRQQQQKRVEDLAACVRDVCSCTKYGGRVVEVDNACALFDVSCWTEHMAELVKERHPDAHVTVRQSSTSLSGFCVYFGLYSSVKRDQQKTLLIILVLAAAAVAGLFFYSKECGLLYEL